MSTKRKTKTKNQPEQGVSTCQFKRQNINIDDLSRLSKTVLDAERTDRDTEQFQPQFGETSVASQDLLRNSSQAEEADGFSDEESESHHSSLLSGSIGSTDDTHNFLDSEIIVNTEETLDFEISQGKQPDGEGSIVDGLLSFLAQKGVINGYSLSGEKISISLNRPVSSLSNSSGGVLKATILPSHTPDINPKDKPGKSDTKPLHNSKRITRQGKTFKYNSIYGDVIKLNVMDYCADCSPEVYSERKKWFNHLKKSHPESLPTDINL